MRLRRLAIASVILVTAGCADRRPPSVRFAPVEATLTPEARALNVAAFDAVWRRVEDSYFRPARLASPEVSWPAVRDEFRRRVGAAPTLAAARELMNLALARLGETHFAVVAGDDHASTRPSDTTVGIDVRPIGATPVVFRVAPDSPAQRSGVRPGESILAIDGRPQAIAATRPLERVIVTERLVRAIDAAPATLTLLGESTARRVALSPTTRPSEMLATLGNLPPMPLVIESRTLDGGVGLFRLSVFLNPAKVIDAFAECLADHPAGVVIDLRGNPGGIGAMASGMAGFLIDSPGQKLGTMTLRDGSIDFAINPRRPHYGGPVAVIVDAFSLSTSEIFAHGLQDLKRATIVGQPTVGAALPSTVTRLPNGDLFQFAVADYTSVGGARLEGVGVTPDVVVPLTREDLLAGIDRPLDAALAIVRRTPATMP